MPDGATEHGILELHTTHLQIENDGSLQKGEDGWDTSQKRHEKISLSAAISD